VPSQSNHLIRSAPSWIDLVSEPALDQYRSNAVSLEPAPRVLEFVGNVNDWPRSITLRPFPIVESERMKDRHTEARQATA
jgi:hypothetical protein